MKERVRGYLEAMDAAGLKENRYVREVRFEQLLKDTEKLFGDLEMQNIKADSIMCATNALSFCALTCFRRFGLSIPSDLAFIGFDGGECFDLYDPPLSYVKQPLEEMGREAFRTVLDLINRSSKTSHIMLNPALIVRNSC